jgi:maltooligosyltrehalose trehalohydrolase
VGDSYRYLTEGLLGAVALPEGGVRFRVWAPNALVVHVEADGHRHTMEPEERGYHAVTVAEAGPGTRYCFAPEGAPGLFADPASRFQPEGVHGPSEVVAPAEPPPAWDVPDLRDLVISELHVGTASTDGTFDGLGTYLDHLAATGVNAVEVMPVAEFPGSRNWGYDGVFPYAVHHGYGGPAGFRRFVERCHDRGMAVILDVVYNHLGPEGNVLHRFGPYFTDRYRTPWGDAINYDGPGSDEVRRYFGGNALMWFEEFEVDALRLDAVHGIVDTAARPFLMELSEAAAELGARLQRPRWLIAESDLNDIRLVAPLADGGFGMDAQWNDDFHHALHALVTGERTGYYRDFGRLQDLAEAFRCGFVYRGTPSPARGRRHGSDSSAVPPDRFVVFAQNHDQIGNRMSGDRLSTLVPFETQKVVTGLTLLAPGIPLLFQGEEYGEAAPFPYFVSHTEGDLIRSVREGRRREFASFEWPAEPPDPQATATFDSARIHPELAREGSNAASLAWTRALLRLRRETPSLRGGVPAEAEADGERRTLVVRRTDGGSQAVLVTNLGVADAPDMAPDGDGWELVLHSSDERWGGAGVPEDATTLPSGSLALWIRPSG